MEALPLEQALAAAREAARDFLRALADLEARFPTWSPEDQAYPLLEQAIETCMERVARTGRVGVDNQIPSAELWKTAEHVLRHGDLQVHARSKPHGYAGDHEMLGKICRQQLCGHPLGRLFDRFFQNQQAPRAVRNRAALAADLLVEEVRRAARASGGAVDSGGAPPLGDGLARYVSVGSGPACEVEWALQRLTPDETRRLRVCLYDLDPRALEYARGRLAPPLAAEQLVCVRENLFRLPHRPQAAAPMEGAQFILCAGFLDYLGAADAAALLGLLWRRLAPGGRLLAFQFSPDNPTRTYMEWIGDWRLIYRGPDELRAVAEQAGIPPAHTRFGAEATGVDLYVLATRPAE